VASAQKGVGSPEDCRYRQPADGDPGRAGQGRQGPLRDALAATQKPAKHTIDVRKLNDDELLQLEQIVAKAGTIISEEPDSEFDEPVPVGYLPITAKSGRRH
jgi:hypothetical protein